MASESNANDPPPPTHTVGDGGTAIVSQMFGADDSGAGAGDTQELDFQDDTTADSAGGDAAAAAVEGDATAASDDAHGTEAAVEETGRGKAGTRESLSSGGVNSIRGAPLQIAISVPKGTLTASAAAAAATKPNANATPARRTNLPAGVHLINKRAPEASDDGGGGDAKSAKSNRKSGAGAGGEKKLIRRLSASDKEQLIALHKAHVISYIDRLKAQLALAYPLPLSRITAGAGVGGGGGGAEDRIEEIGAALLSLYDLDPPPLFADVGGGGSGAAMTDSSSSSAASASSGGVIVPSPDASPAYLKRMIRWFNAKFNVDSRVELLSTCGGDVHRMRLCLHSQLLHVLNIKRMGRDHAVLLFLVLCRAVCGFKHVRLVSGFAPQTLKPNAAQMEELGLGWMSGGGMGGEFPDSSGKKAADSKRKAGSGGAASATDIATAIATHLGETMGVKFTPQTASKLRATLQQITEPHTIQAKGAAFSSLAASAARTGLQRLNLTPVRCVCQTHNLLPPYVQPVFAMPAAAPARRASSGAASSSSSAAAAAAASGRSSSGSSGAPPPALRSSSSAATAIDLTDDDDEVAIISKPRTGSGASAGARSGSASSFSSATSATPTPPPALVKRESGSNGVAPTAASTVKRKIETSSPPPATATPNGAADKKSKSSSAAAAAATEQSAAAPTRKRKADSDITIKAGPRTASAAAASTAAASGDADSLTGRKKRKSAVESASKVQKLLNDESKADTDDANMETDAAIAAAAAAASDDDLPHLETDDAPEDVDGGDDEDDDDADDDAAAIAAQSSDAPWQARCQICGVAGKGKSTPKFLVCGGCTNQYHLKCVKLKRVPAGEWFCERCVSETNRLMARSKSTPTAAAASAAAAVASKPATVAPVTATAAAPATPPKSAAPQIASVPIASASSTSASANASASASASTSSSSISSSAPVDAKHSTPTKPLATTPTATATPTTRAEERKDATFKARDDAEDEDGDGDGDGDEDEDEDEEEADELEEASDDDDVPLKSKLNKKKSAKGKSPKSKPAAKSKGKAAAKKRSKLDAFDDSDNESAASAATAVSGASSSSASAAAASTPYQTKKALAAKKREQSANPIRYAIEWWIEVFSESEKRWIHVDVVNELVDRADGIRDHKQFTPEKPDPFQAAKEAAAAAAASAAAIAKRKAAAAAAAAMADNSDDEYTVVSAPAAKKTPTKSPKKGGGAVPATAAAAIAALTAGGDDDSSGGKNAERTDPMSYVLSAEVSSIPLSTGGVAIDAKHPFIRDLTKRYVNWSVAVKNRADDEWLRDYLKRKSPQPTAIEDIERDYKEDADMDDRTQDEPIPTSLAGVKDHPLYIVAKHVKKYEIIYPNDDASAIGEIKTSKGEVHKVFPRSYLHELHTRDKWLVYGRRVKEDAVAVKQTKRSKLIMKTVRGGEEYTQLFARYQTDPHVVPTATGGIVPKGDHNDVDLRVGLPPNCVHLRFPRIALSCRALGVDFAKAMTGFEIRKRGSVPVFDGVVICAEFEDRVMERYRQSEERAKVTREKKRIKEIHTNWHKLVHCVSVRYKVMAEAQERAHAAAHSSSAKSGETLTAAAAAGAGSGASSSAAGAGDAAGGGGDGGSTVVAIPMADAPVRAVCEHTWSGVERNRVTGVYTKECMLCLFKVECKSDGSLV